MENSMSGLDSSGDEGDSAIWVAYLAHAKFNLGIGISKIRV